MKEYQLPAWYRPQIVLPVLGILYVGIPSQWDFSPHVLTHSMPYFLVGASDYGVGNIYAFTKIIFWTGLMLGAVANTWSIHPSGKGFYNSIKWRLKQNLWCILAAVVLATALIPFMAPDDDVLEIWLLTLYLGVGIITILGIHSLSQIRSLSNCARMGAALFVAIGWGLIRVSLEHP